MMKALLHVLGGFAFLILSAAIGVTAVVMTKVPPQLDFKGSHVWAHMGLHITEKPDTLGAFLAAFEAGAAGVEMDIQYLPEFGRFIVAHDMPPTLDVEKLLFLDTVLSRLAGRGYIWLDWKNLTVENQEVAGERLLYLLAEHGMTDRVYTESRDGSALRELAADGIQTIYWISGHAPPGEFWRHHLRQLFHIYTADYAAVSLSADHLSAATLTLYGHLPVFTWTVNEIDEIDMLCANPDIRVILTDLDYFPH